MPSQNIYEGPETIVVAMDIGTTQSELSVSGRGEPDRLLGGVSFVYFSPGSKPQRKKVF
jgi:hypothetical protein